MTCTQCGQMCLIEESLKLGICRDCRKPAEVNPSDIFEHCQRCEGEGEGVIECNLGHEHDCPDCDGEATLHDDQGAV